ncbi:hypothetical protein NDU88_005124 [Pleurodeles waltl]|uniref:Uncharacterized protein n=1 Tax=Pleurodeles waltl TaxID=8319 RepID=A0AAV7SKY0_PLEWA|nr:hypothetical protein NDU88_005124 [Pleurodeles waltl]
MDSQSFAGKLSTLGIVNYLCSVLQRGLLVLKSPQRFISCRRVRSPLSAVPGQQHATLQCCSATPWVYSERSHAMPQSRSETRATRNSPAPQLGADLRRPLNAPIQ